MNLVIRFLLLMSFTGLVNAENLPTRESSTMSGSSGASTTAGTPMRSEPATAPRTRAAASAEFKADLAFCKNLLTEERRACERETYAARAEGLYR